MPITPEQLGPQMKRMGAALGNVPREATRAGAQAKADVHNKYQFAAGATSFGGRPLKGWRVRMTAKVAVIRPDNVGAVVALNSGTKPHMIGARRLGTKGGFASRASAIAAVAAFQTPGSRDNRGAVGKVRAVKSSRSAKLALSWSGIQHPSPYAFHPGTKGKGFVEKALRTGRADEVGLRTYHAVHRTQVVRAMRG